MKKATIIHSQNHSEPQNRSNIETGERLYDTIGDTNMLRYVQQMLKSTSSRKGESSIVESSKNTSSFDEVHHEPLHQFSNQPENRLSPSKNKDYVTVASVHMIDDSLLQKQVQSEKTSKYTTTDV